MSIELPYNFVPVHPSVYFPQDAGLSTQDIPFKDGICGTIDITIEAETPVFVSHPTSKDTAGPRSFFQTPDGKFGIPGSSVRGVVRSVVEIASFSRLGPVTDRRYGVRDLQNPSLYGKHMATLDSSGGKRGAMATVPLVSAGWLMRAKPEDIAKGKGVAVIVPCNFAKMEYGFVRTLAKERKIVGLDMDSKASAAQKYAAWGNASLDFKAEFDATPVRGPEPANAQLGQGERLGTVRYVRGTGTGQAATLVMTGQPTGPRRGAKHHDFAFFGSAGGPIWVSEAAFRDFAFIHSDAGQQHKATLQPNEEWAYHKRSFDQGLAIPVFFLLDLPADGNTRPLRSFGLAMMFRLAYRHTLAEVLLASQPHAIRERLDFAEALFGRVDPEKKTVVPAGKISGRPALKGRVSFGLCRAVGTPLPANEIRAILSSPKASFYPAYVQQGTVREESEGTVPGRNYATYMDSEGGKPKARLRGWKRYRAQAPITSPYIPPKSKPNQQTVFKPLPTGTVFHGELRVHNVRPDELGALLWALNFGEHPNARHLLGMAKALGYGRVKISVRSCELKRNLDWSDLDIRELDRLRAGFERTMEAWCRGEGQVRGGWAQSAQVAELIACATPLPAGKSLQHLRIDPENQFVAAKLGGHALTPARDLGGWRAAASAVVLENPDARRSRPEVARPEGPRSQGVSAAAALEVGPEGDARDPALDASELAEVRKAINAGGVVIVDLVRRWKQEGGPREAARREIVRKASALTERQRKRNPDLDGW